MNDQKNQEELIVLDEGQDLNTISDCCPTFFTPTRIR